MARRPFMEEQMEIRRMSGDDYDGLYRLWTSCAGMGLNDLDDSREGIEKFLARNPETCFAALEGGEVIGAILAGNDGRRGYLYHTAVRPDWRRRGVARQLVERAMAALEACGVHKAALVVFSRNEAGNLFWERLGFAVREDLTYRDRTIHEMVRFDT